MAPFGKRSVTVLNGHAFRLRFGGLPVRTHFELRVLHPAQIGKVHGFQVRRGNAPAKSSKCLVPGAERVSDCPP